MDIKPTLLLTAITGMFNSKVALLIAEKAAMTVRALVRADTFANAKKPKTGWI